MSDSANSLLEIPQRIVSSYEAQDFRALYEREYWAHQETKHELQKAKDQIEYLESKIQKLEGDIAYLKKLFFAKKAEINQNPAEEINSINTKPHGAQTGHPAHHRKIPWHLPTQDVIHSLQEKDCFCSDCGLPFEALEAEEISYRLAVPLQRDTAIYRRQ